MTIRRARGIISIFWVVGTGLLCIVVSFQTILGRYGKDSEVVWSWLSPLVFPILSMVIAVWSFSENPHEDQQVRSPLVFWGTMLLSLFYLVMLWGNILLEPMSDVGWVNILKASSFQLGLFQALVAGAVGRLFVEYLHFREEPEEDG